MALLSASDQQRLREELGAMARPVRLVFVTQTIGCETCPQARQILDELAALSDNVTIEEINLVLDRERVKRYGIDRVPAVALEFGRAERPDEFEDSRIRFLGTPTGYEFISLVHAVLIAGGRPLQLSERSQQRLRTVERPLTIQVFTTPSCPYCPRAVNLAHELAFANANVTAYAIEATEYPDLTRRYRVTGVPKTVVNDEIEVLGAVPEEAFLDQVLASVAPAAAHDETSAGPART
jgi:glutaredoxin-like protein